MRLCATVCGFSKFFGEIGVNGNQTDGCCIDIQRLTNHSLAVVIGFIDDSSEREVTAKKAMLHNATKSYYLADISKCGKKFAYNICSATNIAGIINDV